MKESISSDRQQSRVSAFKSVLFLRKRSAKRGWGATHGFGIIAALAVVALVGSVRGQIEVVSGETIRWGSGEYGIYQPGSSPQYVQVKIDTAVVWDFSQIEFRNRVSINWDPRGADARAMFGPSTYQSQNRRSPRVWARDSISWAGCWAGSIPRLRL